MTDLQELEEALLSSRDEFIGQHNRNVERAQEQFGKRRVAAKKIDLPQQQPDKAPCKPSKEASGAEAYKTGHVIRLAVRKKKMSLLDEIFEYRSPKISELEARLDAERAARAAGYPVIGYVHSIEKM
ncbi:hypothetical protein [Halomonas heilongjiangensis]|uniref:Uncharacterized protein n=1 Tax=Halomonas heilongjiangensis TaxID=1387883 RepID=A0A2N7TU54_9GAMM|nr:hypothetical protein [Halomonas heilongjiangensis]PMR71729.1 hypothetical protein C1H66_01445 [Halomonas heilongjiangensis]PXX89990.1 hypothetical protein CR158_10435 [Halomonas heilongjiangensis]